MERGFCVNGWRDDMASVAYLVPMVELQVTVVFDQCLSFTGLRVFVFLFFLAPERTLLMSCI